MATGWMELGKVDPGPDLPPPDMSELEARAFMTSDAAYTYTQPRASLPSGRPLLPEDTVTTAKKVSKDMFMVLATGAVVGTILVSGVLMNQGLIVKSSMSKKKIAVRSSAVGAAVAVPIVAYYMQRWN